VYDVPYCLAIFYRETCSSTVAFVVLLRARTLRRYRTILPYHSLFHNQEWFPFRQTGGWKSNKTGNGWHSCSQGLLARSQRYAKRKYIPTKCSKIGNVRINVNIGARSRNHCCCGKVISVTYSGTASVALVIKHAMRMRHTILS
jgi:hypothetical protein